MSEELSHPNAGSRTLVRVLGEELLLDTIASFVDYMETMIMAFENDGSMIGRPIVGNDFCRLLLDSMEENPQSELSRLFKATLSKKVADTLAGGHQEDAVIGAHSFCISPITANGDVVGAIAGSISEIPSGDDELKKLADTAGVDFMRLQKAAGDVFDKPDHIYNAARGHLARLGRMLGRLYEDALEREQAVAQITMRDRELAATRELDERILGSMTAGVAVLDRDLTIRVWNPAAESITKLSSKQAMGKKLLEMMSPKSALGIDSHFREVMDSGASWNDPAFTIDVEDGQLILNVTAAPLKDKSGLISGIVVLFEDITADFLVREQLDRRLRELEAVNKVVAAARSLDPDVLYEQVAKALQETTRADMAAVYLIQDGYLILRGSSLEVDEHILRSVGKYKVGESLVGKVAESGKPEVACNFTGDKRIREKSRLLSAERGLKCLVAMPIISGERVLGVITALSASSEICSEDNVGFINLLSSQLGIAIENSRLFAEIGSTGEFMRSLLDSMAEAAYTCDFERNFTYVNAACQEITGYEPGELLGRNVLELVPEDQRAKLKTMMERRAAGLTDSYEMDIECKDGSRITLRQTVSPLLENGEVTGIVGVATDVTESKAMQRRLEQQNRWLNLLQSIMEKSVSLLGQGKALTTLVNEVAETFGYDICNVFMPAPSGTKLQIVASHGYSPEFIEQLNGSDTFDFEYLRRNDTPIMRVFDEGLQTVVGDILKEAPEQALVEAARNKGFRSMVATPLSYHGQRLGAIAVYTSEIHEFTTEELGLLSSIAAQASVIAGSAQVYEQLSNSEERYRDLYNGAADWMYSLDEDGVILECNDTMSAALSFPREKILGKHIYDFEAGSDRKKARANLVAFREQSGPGRVFSSERTFLTGEGRRVIVEIHARTLPGDGAQGLQWRVVAHDITEKKESGQRLKLLAAAVENTHECVVISDLNGDIVSINEAGAAMFGRSVESMLGMHMGELWSDENPGKLKEEICTKTLDGGWEGQMLYRRQDGGSFPVFVSSAKVEDDQGRPVAMVGIARDISVERNMTNEILRRNRELAVLNAVVTTASASLDLESTLQSSLNTVVKALDYDGGTIFFQVDGAECLEPVAATYDIPGQMREHIKTLRIGDGLSGAIAASGKAIFIDDYQSSPLKAPGMPAAMPMASLGGVPLISKDKILGVLTVGTLAPHEFSEAEQLLLTSVGRSISVAIENARLFNDVARGKNEWETTFDAMTNGVSIHDRDFKIIRANRALGRLLGVNEQELIGKKCYEVFHGANKPLSICPQKKAFKEGVSHSISVEEPHVGRILNISSDPIIDASGEIVGAVHDVRDITEQEHLREQLTQSEKIRALGEMAGGVAHDFNNFLTVILGNCQMLLARGEEIVTAGGKPGLAGLEGDDRLEFMSALQSIQRAAIEAADTVRRIQEFTRVRTTRSFSTVDLNRVIANAIDVARPRWHDEAIARGVKIELAMEFGDLPPVNGNESELGEVFMNLILNAADALPGGGAIMLKTEVEPGGEWLRAVVADNGQGMEKDVRRRIFEPFFTTKGVGGSGLGLSVAYGIVNRHGGDIMVDSRKGKGTRFTVRLPVAALSDLYEATAREEVPELMKQAKVLVIDDAAMIRTLMGDMLDNMGQEFETAASGSEGLLVFDRAAKAGAPFDLVFTDLGMPDMSGWEVVEQIKNRSRRTPVALITGWGDQLDPDKMKESRVDAVIAKPFKVEDIRRLLAKALA
ncbi:MAG: PAS domain S-box protein [Thermoleophilia bacterium]